MEIALGASILNRGLHNGHLDGIGMYTLHLLEGLRSRQQVVMPYVFSSDANTGLAPGFLPFPGNFGFNLLRSAVAGATFAGSAGLEGRIFHATDHRIPHLKGMPVVATLMDPVPLMRSDWVTPAFRGMKNWLFLRSAQWADRVIAISEYAAEDLVHYFRISPQRITVVPLGVDERYFAPVAVADRQAVLTRHGLRADFFLFIGTLQPRKNVERIVDAYLSLPLATRAAHPLVIVGRNGWGVDALVSRLRKLQDEGCVRWLDYVSAEDKYALLHAARALVFPSLYEGFGLPVLEAFAAGLPVITSNTTALPEVAGDAALLVNPLAIDEIADAMVRVAAEPELHALLAHKGRERARRYSWGQCVDRTLAVYQQVVGG